MPIEKHELDDIESTMKRLNEDVRQYTCWRLGDKPFTGGMLVINQVQKQLGREQVVIQVLGRKLNEAKTLLKKEYVKDDKGENDYFAPMVDIPGTEYNRVTRFVILDTVTRKQMYSGDVASDILAFRIYGENKIEEKSYKYKRDEKGVLIYPGEWIDDKHWDVNVYGHRTYVDVDGLIRRTFFGMQSPEKRNFDIDIIKWMVELNAKDLYAMYETAKVALKYEASSGAIDVSQS